MSNGDAKAAYPPRARRWTGFWISPDGEIAEVEGTHIQTVINHPEKFGLDKEFLIARHERHGEPLGVEGRAREEIVALLVRTGWIRIRIHRNFTGVNLDSWEGHSLPLLAGWVREELKSGRVSPHEEFRIAPVLAGRPQVMTAGKLAELSSQWEYRPPVPRKPAAFKDREPLVEEKGSRERPGS